MPRSGNTELTRIGTELRLTRGKLEETEGNLGLLEIKLGVLEEECSTKTGLVKKLDSTVSEKDEGIRKLNGEQRNLKKELSEKDEQLSRIRSSNYYKRLQRWDLDLQRNRDAIEEHASGNCEKKIELLKTKVKQLQTLVSNERLAKVNMMMIVTRLEKK
jgi:chromosome segregation ATPase